MKSKWQNNNYLLFSWLVQLLTATDVTSNSAVYKDLNGRVKDSLKYLLSLMLWLVGVRRQTGPGEMSHVFLVNRQSRRQTNVKSLHRKSLSVPFPMPKVF